MQVNLKREKLELTPVYSTAMEHEGHKLGYIRLVNFSQKAALDMQHAIDNLQVGSQDSLVLLHCCWGKVGCLCPTEASPIHIGYIHGRIMTLLDILSTSWLAAQHAYEVRGSVSAHFVATIASKHAAFANRTMGLKHSYWTSETIRAVW